MTKYKVKKDCRIEHNGKSYSENEEVELNPDLALFHAANIKVVAEILAEKSPKVVAAKPEKSGVDVS